MQLLSRTEEIILMAIVNLKDKAYGITIRKYVSKATGFKWSIGAVYAPLHRLEEKGYVKTIKGEPLKERGGRSKIYYQVTQDGKEALLKLKTVNDNIWKRVSALE
ncbi:MAG: PadR family transcriptional regulator [Candidatus Aminicenantes bacterium]|nr:PadR family transcriptional regulator [Candidatus Aminicenantes bacterium]MDH5383565.1 PadR family transcriptional regulator [Candidatus Aminicenantes bacterium]MDH5744799.1 PadR family transcriptional regulator [Candidatus Aminicenantes bacterium]